MRVSLSVLAATAFLVLAPVAQAAWPSRVPLPLRADHQRNEWVVGPFLAGADVVFRLQASATAPARVYAAPVGGGPARVLPGPSVVAGAGLAGVLARAEVVEGGGSDRNDPTRIDGETLLAGPVDGPAVALTTCVAPAQVEGARVAYVGGDGCRELVVRDVAAGAEVARLPLEGPSSRTLDLRLAGDRVAWRNGDGLVVADLRTGTTRAGTLPAGTDTWTLAPDGALAFAGTTSSASGWTRWVVARPAVGEPDRPVGTWPSGTSVRVAGFADGAPVVVVDQAVGTRVFALHPDGTRRPLLVARQKLLGLDLEGDRIAWALRDCDEVAVAAAAIADLPAAGQDVTTSRRCPRVALDRRTIVLDRRGRGTVAVRCAQACRGWLTLTATVPSDDVEWEQALRRVAHRRFSLPAGRHRLPVRLQEEDRRRVARSPVHLPVPGQSGGGVDAGALPLRVAGKFVHGAGARPDEAHLAAQHIEDLRQLIKTGRAHDPAPRNDPRVARAIEFHHRNAVAHQLLEILLVNVGLGVHSHAAKFVNHETPAGVPDPLLAIENRAGRRKPHGDHQQDHERQPDWRRQNDERHIEDALPRWQRRLGSLIALPSVGLIITGVGLQRNRVTHFRLPVRLKTIRAEILLRTLRILLAPEFQDGVAQQS